MAIRSVLIEKIDSTDCGEIWYNDARETS